MPRTFSLQDSSAALRHAAVAVTACAALLLTACGGGGSASGTTTGIAPSTGTSSPVNTSSTVQPTPSAAGNVVPVSIRQLPSNSTTLTANTPYVSVTVCAPGGACQTVPNVLVDTGSAGLRLFSGALSGTLLASLPPIASGGGTLAACAQFASGYAWGSMRLASVQLGGMVSAGAIPVQVMNDPNLPAAPASCTAQGVDFASDFAGIANGILGISNFRYDCGAACARSAANGVYFSCGNGACSGTTAVTSQQGVNPVATFATNNNGSILALPAVPLPNGAPSTTGALIFGIDTQSNNTLTSAQIYPLDKQGNLPLTLDGVTQTGFVDSGSNGYYLDLSGVPTCASGFYCPQSPLTLTAQLQTASGTSGPAQSITIGNAQQMFATQNAALPALGGPAAISGLVDLGLPFFYGRAIATGIEGTNPAAPNGYLAY